MFLNSSIVYVRLKQKIKLFIINGELVIIKNIYIYIIKKLQVLNKSDIILYYIIKLRVVIEL